MDSLFDLEDNLLLFFTGFSRSAGSILQRSEGAHRSRPTRDAAQPALREGARAAQPRGARGGRPRRVRRADARALGAQEAPLGRHEQSANRRMVRARTAGTARSAASWSAPAVAGSCCSTARSTAGCATRWRAPAWKRCGSASTSRARRCCSDEPARRDPGRWAGDAAAADDRADSQVAGRGRRPPVRRAPDRAARPPRDHRHRVSASGIWARWCSDALGDGSRLGRAASTTSSTARVLLGTGGALRRAAARSSAIAFFVLYGDSYLECDYAAVERTFVASGRPA